MKKILISNGIEYDVDSKIDCVNRIIEEYHKNSVSMYDVLASIYIAGFTVEEVFEIYAECINISDGDTILHFRGHSSELDIDDNYEIIRIRY